MSNGKWFEATVTGGTDKQHRTAVKFEDGAVATMAWNQVHGRFDAAAKAAADAKRLRSGAPPTVPATADELRALLRGRQFDKVFAGYGRTPFRGKVVAVTDAKKGPVATVVYSFVAGGKGPYTFDTATPYEMTMPGLAKHLGEGVAG